MDAMLLSKQVDELCGQIDDFKFNLWLIMKLNIAFKLAAFYPGNQGHRLHLKIVVIDAIEDQGWT